MKILIDIDDLERTQIVSAPMAATLRQHALRDTGSTAINILLAFGAIAIAAGILALHPSTLAGALFGLAFVVGGGVLKARPASPWRKLGGIWMIVGALILAAGTGALIDQPLLACLVGALILLVVGFLAGSRLLIALTPLALLAAIGGSTGYWHACYGIAIEEPTLTVLLFSALSYGGWLVVKATAGLTQDLSLAFTRMSLILVNFGFWIGSLWGDTPGHSWRQEYAGAADRQIPELIFVLAWAVALLAAGAWGARNGRRFLVNVAATFGGILVYTQWFERMALQPISVIAGGLFAIAIGLGLWNYNRRVLMPGEPRP